MINNFIFMPVKEEKTVNNKIYVFDRDNVDRNIDLQLVDGFGDEWTKFNQFTDKELDNLYQQYFDVLKPNIININSVIADFGCGTGRFSNYFIDKVAHIDLIDPSHAIYVAEKYLGDNKHCRFLKTSIGALPIQDETYDFAMSIGVLHHIPNTEQALRNCVLKVKKGGNFYLYLYYNLDKANLILKFLFYISSILRLIISRLPYWLKSFVCDLIAIFIYWPLARISTILTKINLKNIIKHLPLNFYYDKTFKIMRNDALDRFGTTLEKRYSKKEMEEMMVKAGLVDIQFSNSAPYWHAIGRRQF